MKFMTDISSDRCSISGECIILMASSIWVVFVNTLESCPCHYSFSLCVNIASCYYVYRCLTLRPSTHLQKFLLFHMDLNFQIHNFIEINFGSMWASENIFTTKKSIYSKQYLVHNFNIASYVVIYVATFGFEEVTYSLTDG